MNVFNPGEGWREVEYDDSENDVEVVQHWVPGEGRWRTYVREEPVPPLPTERDTVIRVDWKPEHRLAGDRCFLGASGWESRALVIPPEKLRERITGFEVLAEPVTEFDTDREVFERRVRRETAEAVLDRMDAELADPDRGLSLRMLRREFGVEVSS